MLKMMVIQKKHNQLITRGQTNGYAILLKRILMYFIIFLCEVD